MYPMACNRMLIGRLSISVCVSSSPELNIYKQIGNLAGATAVMSIDLVAQFGLTLTSTCLG